jgi:hypothetical protein
MYLISAGQSMERTKWQARESQRLSAEQAERERIAKLGHIAATFAIQEQQRAAERQQYLTGVMHHAKTQFSLVARPPAGAGQALVPEPLAAGLCVPAHVPGLAPADQPKPACGESSAPGGAGAAAHRLTLGAVWLWNAALTGQADGAAGACRVDALTGQANPACAQPSGLDLDAAFANQAANAQACLADRAAHQRLLDYLNSLQTPGSTTPPSQ